MDEGIFIVQSGAMTTRQPVFDSAGEAYQQTRIAHWDAIACKRDRWQGMGKWYHERLTEIYRFYVTPNQKVLELGCGDGRLLAALKGGTASKLAGYTGKSERMAQAALRSRPVRPAQRNLR